MIEKKNCSPVRQSRRNRNPVTVKHKGVRDIVESKGLARLNI